jgi:hypothetical protein
MKIYLKKFGTMLISRQNGREAFAAFQTQLSNFKDGENLELDFEGVMSFAPSWGDEFLTPLAKKYGKKMILTNTSNPSVKATLEMLEEVNQLTFEK